MLVAPSYVDLHTLSFPASDCPVLRLDQIVPVYAWVEVVQPVVTENGRECLRLAAFVLSTFAFSYIKAVS